MKMNLSFDRYDRTTIALHWLTLFLVAEQWIGAHIIDDFPKGDPRVDARSVHISLGILLGVVLLVRIIWRVTRGKRLPAADTGLLHILAKAVQGTLYALLFATVGAGILFVLVRGDSFFGLFHIASIAPGDRALRHLVGTAHAWMANLILIVAGAHAFAALVHHFVWRDDVMRRMLPPRN
jgi:cytochrome b561